jgi:hypothetical protein
MLMRTMVMAGNCPMLWLTSYLMCSWKPAPKAERFMRGRFGLRSENELYTEEDEK